MGSITGPLSDALAAKLVVYCNDDNGWFGGPRSQQQQET